jgi:hypothetical protein
VVLIYLLVGEQIISVALGNADSESTQALAGYLPGNAGDVAVLTGPVYSFAELIPDEQVSGAAGSQFVEVLSGVTDPPGTGVALLVLAVWTALVVGLAGFFNARRDIT